MKLSKTTLQILENFSQIDRSIHIDEPQIIKIKNTMGVIGLAKIQEDLNSLSIYDLSEFIQVIKMFDQSKDIEFDYNSTTITFKQGKTTVNTVNSNPNHIYNKCKTYESYFKSKDFNASISLNEGEVQTIFRASSVLLKSTKQVDKVINIKMKGGTGKLTLLDSVNSAANKYVQDIEGSGDCDITFLVPDISILKGNYDVFVFQNHVKFINGDVCYIFVEKS